METKKEANLAAEAHLAASSDVLSETHLTGPDQTNQKRPARDGDNSKPKTTRGGQR